MQLINIGNTSQEVEIYAYIFGADYNEFLGIQEELLLQVLAVVESTGTALAVPTQLTHIVYESDAEPRRQDEKAVTLGERRRRDAP